MKRGPYPPWAGRRGRWGPDDWPHAQRRQGRLFLRFAGVFGLFALLLFGGLALLIFLIVRLAGGDRHTAALIWASVCGLLILVPMIAGWLGRRAFRGIAAPLADLMAAADAVAGGDLSVRLDQPGNGPFARLAHSFNHMVEELALADRRRRNLTADVAHELRTPLQIIQGNLEGVLDGVYAPTAEHISATLEETRLLARLVEDLRVLSQAEAGQLQMAWEPVDVAELLVDVATSFSGQAQAAGIALTTNVSSNGSTGSQAAGDGPAGNTNWLMIQGDYGRLDQVLGNLTANALRHTPAGGTITLRAEPTPEGVRIEVGDTGEGIAADDLPYVFDRFWRADRARGHGQGAGSGLGLAIARQLVQAHGGRIGVASEVGHGTTVTIDLKRQAG